MKSRAFVLLAAAVLGLVGWYSFRPETDTPRRPPEEDGVRPGRAPAPSVPRAPAALSSLAGHIRGEIVDAASGAPVGGVRVEAAEVRLGLWRTRTSARTGPTGRFSLGPLPSGREFQVRVRVAGRAGFTKDVPVGGRVRIELSPGCSLEGIVRWEDSRERVSGAHLVFRHSDRYWWGDANTDPQGRYRIDYAPPGGIHVYLCGPEHPEYRAGHLLVAVGQPATRDFLLPRGIVIGGTVLHDGKPVPGAVVTNGELKRTETDGNGRFELTGCGHREVGELYASASGDRFGATPVTLDVNDRRIEVRIDLERRAPLRGRVFADGRPVAGAIVGRESTLLDDAVTTDSDGRFLLPATGLAWGTIAARAEGRGMGFLPIAPGSRAEEPEVRIDLPRTLTVRGRVAAAEGEPVPHARLTLEQSPWLSVGSTGPDGSFEIVAFRPGRATVRIRCDGFIRISGQGIEVIEGKTTEDVELITEKGGTLTGVLLDSAGRPVSGAYVFGGGTWTYTAADGTFHLDGILHRRVEVYAWAQGSLCPAAGEFAAGATGIVLELPKPCSIIGVLKDGFGKPVPSFKVRLRCEGLEGDEPILGNDPEGGFSRGGLPAGDYEAVGMARGLLTRRHCFRMEEGESRVLELRLQPGGILSGRVLDDAGHPVEGAKIRLSFEDESRLVDLDRTTRTNRNGWFRLDSLPDGKWEIEASAVGLVPHGRTVEISHRRETDVRFTLPLECRLRVRVRDSAGKPLAIRNVWVQASDGTMSGRTDASGTAVFPHLPPGPARAWTKAGGTKIWSPPVDLAQGETAEVEIVVDRAPK